MADYQKMYTTLFNAITDAISILQRAQQEAEELYISAAEPIISVVDKQKTVMSNDAGKRE